jgi:threonine synthase
MVAAEVSGWLSRSLEQGSPWEGESEVGRSAAFNLLTSRSTYQGYAALLESGGIAVQVGEEEILAMQHTLARGEGFYGEASSVIALAALERLAKEGQGNWVGGAVAILTSAGIKDPAATARGLPPLQVSEPALNAVLEAIGDRVPDRRA